MSLRIVEKDEKFNKMKRYNLRKHKGEKKKKKELRYLIVNLRIVEKDERFNEVKQYNLRKHKENEMENFKATVEPNDLG